MSRRGGSIFLLSPTPIHVTQALHKFLSDLVNNLLELLVVELVVLDEGRVKGMMAALILVQDL